VSGEDMLKREHFEDLMTALTLCSEGDGGSNERSSVKLALGYLLKKSAEVMQGVYLLEKKDDRCVEIEYFEKLLKHTWGENFADALYKVDRRRREKLRKPSELPLEEDLKIIRDYCNKVIQELGADSYRLLDVADFIKLRAALVARLTVFNARRGSEPARLELIEWESARAEEWIDKQRISSASESDADMLKQFRLAYQAGKGNHDVVPVLFPEDTVQGIRKLIEARQAVGVHPNNTRSSHWTTSLVGMN
jgi:hypothetical protein